MDYKIEVSPEPDYEMRATPYYWVVLKWSYQTNGWYNASFGWSKTPQKALEKALEEYNDLIK